MNIHLAILLVTLAIGVSVLWSGPRKLANQAISFVALLASVWLALLWALRIHGLGNPVLWLRVIAVLASIFPWFLWWLGFVVRNQDARWRDLLFAGRYWGGYALGLAALACSEWYIPSNSTPEHKMWGAAYAWHTLVLMGGLVVLLAQALRWIQARRGESRPLVLGLWIAGTVACLLGVTLTAGLRVFGLSSAPSLAPWVALVFFLGLALLITSRRLFDSHVRLLALVRRVIGLILSAYLVEAWINLFRDHSIPEIALTSAIVGAAFLTFYEFLTGQWMRAWLRRDSQAVVVALQELSSGLRKMLLQDIAKQLGPRLATILGCDDVVVFLRRRPGERFVRFSFSSGPAEIPESLETVNDVTDQRSEERLAWEIRESDVEGAPWLKPFVVGLRQGDPDGAEVVALLGRRRSRSELLEAERSGLQSLLIAFQHTITSRDIAALEVAQRQLIETGKIAAGVAHNIRNPLAVVRAYVESDANLDSATRGELHRLAVEEVAHIQRVVDGLSALARGELFALTPCDLHTLVADAVEAQAKYLASCGAPATVALVARRYFVLAESAQMATALANLLRNSAEEIAKTGTAGRIELNVAEENAEFITLRLADSGRGLPPEIEQAVFTRDLFAKTTKPQGSVGRATGYGLGLHSTMLIVNIGHGGRFFYRDRAFYLALRRAPAASPSREK